MMIENDIEHYITLTKKHAIHHKKQAYYAKSWFNFFNLTIVFLMASQSLLMTILSLLDQNISVLEVTITSSVLSFAVLILNKISSNYEFLSLHFQHFHIAIEYENLYITFKNIDHENGLDFIQHIHTYNHLLSKSNIQEVSNYYSLLNCIKYPKPDLDS